ncbi:MAG TPA: response regulator [Minicystis sp.]|nr:response regulator [Minicystis sp.]
MAASVVLVVDDNPMNLKLVRFVLKRAGFDVHEAVDAEQALAVLREMVPAVILVDLQLPGMDGLELTRRIKADARTRDVPVVAVTAFAMKGDEERATRAGCDAYVTKPIDTNALPALVAGFAARAAS